MCMCKRGVGGSWAVSVHYMVVEKQNFGHFLVFSLLLAKQFLAFLDFYRTNVVKFFGGNEIYEKCVISTRMVYEMVFSVSKLVVLSFEDKKVN